MTYSVYQPWDPLRVCALGRSYPKEFFQFIKHSSARYVFERMADEIEEDLQNCTLLLESFGVQVVRTSINEDFTQHVIGDGYLPPPLTPRDDTGMVGDVYFTAKPIRHQKWESFRGDTWPELPPQNLQEWEQLTPIIKEELKNNFKVNNLLELYYRDHSSLKPLEEIVKQNGNKIVYNQYIDTAMTCRIGKDLYFGTWTATENKELLKEKMQTLFPNNRCHVINSCGHLDGVISPFAPGLIFSSRNLSLDELQKHFPGWEVHFVDFSVQSANANFKKLKRKNGGKWWVPGEESNQEFTNFVESYIQNWLGYCEETTFGVNLLSIDEKNIICLKEDDKAFKVLQKYGITPHVAKFRHYNFFDSGWHCLTSDLHRDGKQNDYFPERA